MKYKRLFLKLTDEEIRDAIIRFHFEDHEELIYSLLAKIDLWIKPQCFYIYRSHCSDSADVVVTLGDMIDQRNQEFQEQEHFLVAHALDCLSLVLLSQSYKKIQEIIYREKRQFVTDISFLEEKEIPPVIKIFQNEDSSFPVVINEAGALIPAKTVVFQCKLSSQYKESHFNCRNCPNITCTFRNYIL